MISLLKRKLTEKFSKNKMKINQIIALLSVCSSYFSVDNTVNLNKGFFLMTSKQTKSNDNSCQKKRTNIKSTHSENKIFSEKFPEVTLKIFVET